MICFFTVSKSHYKIIIVYRVTDTNSSSDKFRINYGFKTNKHGLKFIYEVKEDYNIFGTMYLFYV